MLNVRLVLTSPSSAAYQLSSATSFTGFQSGEGLTSRSPLWSVTAWLVLRRNTWWNCAILLARSAVGRQCLRSASRGDLDRCSEVSASNIRPSGLCCLRPPNLELSAARDQTIAWQFIAFQTETESAFRPISAVLSAYYGSILYLMKGRVSFLYSLLLLLLACPFSCPSHTQRSLHGGAVGYPVGGVTAL